MELPPPARTQTRHTDEPLHKLSAIYPPPPLPTTKPRPTKRKRWKTWLAQTSSSPTSSSRPNRRFKKLWKTYIYPLQLLPEVTNPRLKNPRHPLHISMPPLHPRNSIRDTQTGSTETNRPAHFSDGKTKITVTPAASILQNGTPAIPVPPPAAAALRTTSNPPEPTSWEDQRNTARWSASDGAAVCYIH